LKEALSWQEDPCITLHEVIQKDLQDRAAKASAKPWYDVRIEDNEAQTVRSSTGTKQIALPLQIAKCNVRRSLVQPHERASYAALSVAEASRIHGRHPERYLFAYGDLPLAPLGVGSTLRRPTTGIELVEARIVNIQPRENGVGKRSTM
jgi:hypothetical protein